MMYALNWELICAQTLTVKEAPKRHVRYALRDAFLRFWYRFVFPHLSLIRQNPAAAFKDEIAGGLESYFGQCFERFCRDALGHVYASEGVKAAFKTGAYWDKHVQIDVVGVRHDNWIDLGECKWGDVASSPALVDELERKVSLFPNPTNASIGRLIFTRRPVKAPKGGSPARFFSLEKLYSLG